MDTLTHSLVALTASKAGLEKLSPATSVACVLAANAPDIDFICGIVGDRWTLLHYHRGITHSILGTIFLSFLIAVLFWLGDSLISTWRKRARTIRFRGLLLATLIVGASHPLLDWTNNYGVRPLLPWSGQWFYGDLVFIIDPFLWMGLGACAFLVTSRTRLQLRLWAVLVGTLTILMAFAGPIRGAFDHPWILMMLWIAVLIMSVLYRQFGSARPTGKSAAFAGLALVLIYWGGLALLHHRALEKAGMEASVLAAMGGEKVTKLAAMPTLANPTHWLCVAETESSFYRFELYLSERSGGAHKLARFTKPTAADVGLLALAERDRRVQALLGFARFPIGHVVDHDCLTETFVQFADLRYTEPGRSRGNFALELPVECPPRPKRE